MNTRHECIIEWMIECIIEWMIKCIPKIERAILVAFQYLDVTYEVGGCHAIAS